MAIKDFGGKIAVNIERAFKLSSKCAWILCYHSISDGQSIVDVSRDTFTRQIEYLRNNFEFISLTQAMRVASGTRDIKLPSVALTFDDGYADLFETAVPLLDKYHIPATVFVLAQPEHADRTQLTNNKTLLSMPEVTRLYSMGWEIGSHTLTHPDLTKIDTETLRNEIIESKFILENAIHDKVKYFAYPRGLYNETVMNVCREAGYGAAFTTEHFFAKPGTNLYAMPRVCVDRTHTGEQIAFLLTRSASNYFAMKKLIHI